MTTTADTAHLVAQDQNDRALQLATFARNTPLMRAIERIDTGSAADATEALRYLKSAAANIASAGHAAAETIIASILRSQFPTARILHVVPVSCDELDGFIPTVLRDKDMNALWVHRVNANWDLDDRPDWEQQLESACASLTNTGAVRNSDIITEALR